MKTHYDELGIATTASPEEVKTAYRALIRTLHPDFIVPNETLEEQQARSVRFLAVQKAYEVLSDPERRRNYDTCGMDISPDERARRCHAALAEAINGALDADWPFGAPDLITIVRQSITRKQSETYTANRKDINKLEKFRKHRQELVFKGTGPSQSSS